MSRDRERSKLERDVALFQMDLPVHARHSLDAAINTRAFVIAERENEESSRLMGYVYGIVLTWSLALVGYTAWRLAYALTVLNWVCFGLALALPAFTIGAFAFRTDRRRALYRHRLAERGETAEPAG